MLRVRRIPARIASVVGGGRSGGEGAGEGVWSAARAFAWCSINLVIMSLLAWWRACMFAVFVADMWESSVAISMGEEAESDGAMKEGWGR